MNKTVRLDKTALRKALTSTGDGEALLPYDIESYLSEELLKQQPLVELIDVLQSEGRTHEFNIRTSHPMGWFEGESTGPNFKNGTYVRKSTMLKIQRIWGEVTGFAKAMDEAFIDALVLELEGSLQGMSDLYEYGVMYACSDDIGFTGDPYQFTGIFPRIAKLAPENIIDAGSNKVELGDLDVALAKVGAFRQSRHDPKLWLMGLQMKLVVDGLQTRIQIPLTQTVLNDGKIVMANYADSPIFETNYLVPDAISTSPADLAGTVGADGSLAGSFKYRIASVTAFGEQVALAATDTQDCTAGSKKVALAWTADPDAKLYMIFRQAGGSGDFNLLDIIAAITYDGEGKVSGNVESYIDAGARTPVAVKPLEAGEEQIMLINRNPERGTVFLGKVDDMGRQTGKLMSYVDLARTKDAYSYFIKSYVGIRVKYPNVAAACIRHVKRA